MYVTSTMYFDRLNAEQLRVLVVEPKELVAARLKTQLERLGHLVLGPAKDGQEAVAVAQRLNPSLVLIDSKLPGGDGIETARAIDAVAPGKLAVDEHKARIEPLGNRDRLLSVLGRSEHEVTEPLELRLQAGGDELFGLDDEDPELLRVEAIEVHG